MEQSVNYEFNLPGMTDKPNPIDFKENFHKIDNILPELKKEMERINPFTGLQFVPVTGKATAFDFARSIAYDNKLIAANAIYDLDAKEVTNFSAGSVPTPTWSGLGATFAVQVVGTAVYTYWAAITNINTTNSSATLNIYRANLTNNSAVELYHSATVTDSSVFGSLISGHIVACAICADNNNMLAISVQGQYSGYYFGLGRFFNISAKTLTNAPQLSAGGVSYQIQRIYYITTLSAGMFCYLYRTGGSEFSVVVVNAAFPTTGFTVNNANIIYATAPYFQNLKEHKVMSITPGESSSIGYTNMSMCDFGNQQVKYLGRFLMFSSPKTWFTKDYMYMFDFYGENVFIQKGDWIL